MGAAEQAGALATRAAYAAFDSPYAVAEMMDVLREDGATEQLETLVSRLPAEGWFDLFTEPADHQMRYRWGREPDGSPARPWGWDDLD